MPRELFVEKRAVRRQQIDDAAILFQLSIEKQLHFPDECDSQVVVEPGKLLVEIRCEQPDISRLQPFLEEVLHQRGACTLVTQHAPDLSIEHSRLVQLSLNGDLEQSFVRDAAPKEEREARGKFEIADAIRDAGFQIGGFAFDVGSFEGATMSGKLASYALSSSPALSTVIGYPTVPRPERASTRPARPARAPLRAVS